MNISFALTTKQFRDRSKVVTRRLGWKRLQPGAVLHAIEKGQGLKPGEHPVHLGQIRIVEVRPEPISRMLEEPYGKLEAALEGFPGMSGAEFVTLFCSHMHCHPGQLVTRIHFEYLDAPR